MIPATALAAVPGAGPDDPPPRVVPLGGGLLNRTFLVETRAGRYVLRLAADATPMRELGVDRAFELAAQRLAAGAGLAPHVVASAEDHAFLVSEFVAGEAGSEVRSETPAGLRRLGETLARLRRLPVAGLASVGRSCTGTASEDDAPRARASRPPPNLIERTRWLVGRARAQAGRDAAASLARALEAAEQGWLAAGAADGAARRARCLVHSDPNPGNVLWPPGDGPLLLLDWEYAHVGDPLQDPAAWLQSCPAWRGREARVLRACGLDDVADAGMLAGMVRVYEALGQAWLALAETAAGIPAGRRAN
ncbi:MAG: phosphotransferase [Steroidobacteraceae bacterium]|nr:phosphotransferase [Steroidobacteraceae bacterium]